MDRQGRRPQSYDATTITDVRYGCLMSTTTPRIVWWTLGVGLVARLVVVHWSTGIALILDELNYFEYAQHLAATGLLPDAFRPPLYPAFIAATTAIGGMTATPVRSAQALTAIGAGWVMYRWLRGHVGHMGALVSTALWCLHPVLIGYTHLLWTETVFLSLLIFFLATALPSGGLSLKRTAASGVLFGLITLTRSVLSPVFWLAPLFVIAQPSRFALRKNPGLRTLIFLASFGLTMAPWVAHNVWVEGRPILTETTHGYNLWKGNTDFVHPLATEGPQYPGPIVSIPMFPYEGSGPRITVKCEAEHRSAEPFTRWHLSRCAQALAIDHIIADPVGFLSRGFVKLGHAFHPSNLLSRHYWLGLYGEWPPTLGLTLVWSTALSSLFILGLGILGLIRAPMAPIKLLLCGLGTYQLSVIFVSFGNTRFRLVVVLTAIILSAWAVKKRPD